VVTEADRAVEAAIRAALTTGHLGLAVQTRGQVWDYAAPSLIVEEAGGRFRGLDGEPLKMGGPALFARSAGLQAAALEILNPAG
jgi:histidinol-phosphatase